MTPRFSSPDASKGLWKMRCLLLLALLAGIERAEAGERNHTYAVYSKVPLYVNKVGPYHNPQETYPYFALPFCKPQFSLAGKLKNTAGLGEVLDGHELRDSGIQITFRKDVSMQEICTTEKLSKVDAGKFRSAVRKDYCYSMYLDDLPIWSMVGNMTAMPQRSKPVAMLYTHRVFDIAYNGNRVYQVSVASGKPVEVKEGDAVTFTYSVNWHETDKPFEQRWDEYLDNAFFEHQIHWFSIFNSFMMVIFLCGLVFLILIRTVRNDFAKYAREEEEAEPGLGDESGWKQLHGDVFREPPHLMLFSALYGTGWQLAVLAFGVILYAALGRFHGEVYEERGEVTQSVLSIYSLTSVVAGYASGSYYRQYFNTPRREMQDSKWQQTMLFTILLFPGVIVGVVSFLNIIAMSYSTSNVLSFTVVANLFLIWIFISFPLAVIGTLFGRHWGGKNTFPCRVNTYPRDLPEATPWYAKWYFVIPATGLLPFGSIFIEMYFIFTSFWNYNKFYYVYGFMLLVYLILMVVTICTTVVAVYFVLNAENHKWQWLSFNAAGSTAVYVFAYAVYYFYFKTSMKGFLQVAFYFGYMSVFCIGLYILCGTVGVAGSMAFVRTIYMNIKVD